ncbi:TPA: hypothetical protein JZG64_004603 [Escherichia coli]|nr:hypothetical protein [Escherichia coli]HAX5186458.1 hypothetical protein [Escherichia coli]HAX5233327.1 hypothetical protein [Escherichia coli]HAX5274208.1 hypothetical protein [Escherichia coli]
MKNSNGEKTGSLSTNMYIAGAVSTKDSSGSASMIHLYAPAAGCAFWGGLPISSNNVSTPSVSNAERLVPGVTDNFNWQGVTVLSNINNVNGFTDTTMSYSAFYASGISSGQNIKIPLDSPVSSTSDIQ